MPKPCQTHAKHTRDRYETSTHQTYMRHTRDRHATDIHATDTRQTDAKHTPNIHETYMRQTSDRHAQVHINGFPSVWKLNILKQCFFESYVFVWMWGNNRKIKWHFQKYSICVGDACGWGFTAPHRFCWKGNGFWRSEQWALLSSHVHFLLLVFEVQELFMNTNVRKWIWIIASLISGFKRS